MKELLYTLNNLFCVRSVRDISILHFTLYTKTKRLKKRQYFCSRFQTKKLDYGKDPEPHPLL